MSGRASELPWWVTGGVLPALNLLAAFVVTSLMLLAIGEDPLACFASIIQGAFGYGEGIGYTLFYTTNFIFTGLAFAVAFHAGLFNIGAEGQAYMAGLGVTAVCLNLEGFPLLLVVPLAIAASAAFGAAWAFVPAYLQAKRGSHVVITTIMFNFIASALIVYLLNEHLRPAGSMNPETRTFVEGVRLPFVHDVLGWFGIPAAKSPLNLAFVFALIAAWLASMLLWRTRLGYELRTFGANPTAAIYAGMSPVRLTVIAMLLSGGIAGLMALNEIMGAQHRLVLEFTAGYGFVGIAVALMGRSAPLGIVFSALLFGALYQGGAELGFERPNVTRDTIILIQGLVILFAGALEYMFKPAITAWFARSASSAIAEA
jgi:simple sugar transport system permease protein